jgi:hypothetical protein
MRAFLRYCTDCSNLWMVKKPSAASWPCQEQLRLQLLAYPGVLCDLHNTSTSTHRHRHRISCNINAIKLCGKQCYPPKQPIPVQRSSTPKHMRHHYIHPHMPTKPHSSNSPITKSSSTSVHPHKHEHNASHPSPLSNRPNTQILVANFPSTKQYVPLPNTPHRPQPVNKHPNTLPYPYPSPTRVCLRFPIGVKQVADADTERNQLHDQRHGWHGRLEDGVGEWGRKAVLRWRSECECWSFCERCAKRGGCLQLRVMRRCIGRSTRDCNKNIAGQSRQVEACDITFRRWICAIIHTSRGTAQHQLLISTETTQSANNAGHT